MQGQQTRGALTPPPRQRLLRSQVGPWTLRARAWLDDAPPDAPLVLCAHGFIISSRYLVPTARLLARRFRVEAPDLPGFGLSDKPHDMLDIDALADAFVGWMNARGHERAHMLGNSMGCQVLAALAQRHPERVDRMVLIGPTTDAYARTVPRQAARLLHDMTRERPSLPFLHMPDYARTGLRRVHQMLHHVMQDRIEARAPHVAAPTLVQRGTRDALVSDRFARELARRIPAGIYHPLKGSPHVANYTAPERVVESAIPFLLGEQGPEALDAGRTAPTVSDGSDEGAAMR